MTIYDTPRMSWQDFLNIPNGTRVFNHGASECVALANLYNEGVLGGGFVRVASALQWWTNGNVAPVHGFSRISSAPQVGDIFIGSGGIYNLPFGHIGVVTRAWDGSTFGTMEQNVVGQFVSRHNRTMQNIDGFLRPVNQAPIAPPAPVLKGNQRQAGPSGANRRQGPSSKAALLEPALKANEVGNFIGWIHGEDPYGKGNNIWFQGLSGNWFYSGAFTDSGTHDLVDLNPPAPTPVPVPEPEVIPEPAPVPEPEKPSVKPEENEHRPLPKPEEPEVSEPTASPVPGVTAEEWVVRQQNLASQIKPVDLGSIIGSNKIRKIVWAIYGILGLFIVGIVGGLTAINAVAPEWFMFTMGVYTALGPAFSSLAIANINTNK
jgi:hypothetical protein